MTEENEDHCIDKDDLLRDTQLNIEKYGLQVIMVGATDYLSSFAYSIGLTQTYKHPEIICFGLPDDVGHAIINDIAEIVQKGQTLEVGKIYTEIFKNNRATFLKVDQRSIGDYFGAALNYYDGKSFDALQVIWTDGNDRFPWDEDFEETLLYHQPLLDRNAAFKFSESQNLAIFTTRQWLEEQKPILKVVHDAEGDWLFLTADSVPPEDIKIVALSQIIKQDLTLNEVFDLDYGEEAEREFLGAPWLRK